MINGFRFGAMVIDGTSYTSDLVIYPDGRIVDSWWRKNGHRLVVDDISELIQSSPEVIVVGTGVYGYMKPESGLIETLLQKDISFIADKNEQAIAHYNAMFDSKRIGACFHLTC
jgi:hypothetical protein